MGGKRSSRFLKPRTPELDDMDIAASPAADPLRRAEPAAPPGGRGEAGGAAPAESSSIPPLSRRYALILLASALPLFLLVGGLALYQFEAQRARQLDVLDTDLQRARLVVDGVIADTLDHIARLRIQGGDIVSDRGLRPRPGLRALLGPSSPPGSDTPDGLTLDHMNTGPAAGTVGNVFVARDRTNDGVEGEIAMAIALFEPMRLAHEVSPYLRWSYYFSASGALITMYPYVSRQTLVEGFGHGSIADLIDAFLSYDVYLDATPSRNPGHAPYWSPPYLDAAGAGWMVSHAAPILKDGSFVGTVGTDLLLSFLDDTLRGLPDSLGRLWIVGPLGDLIADREGAGHAGDEPRRLEAVMATADPEATLATITNPGRHRIDGHRIVSAPVAGTPWTLVHAIADEDMSALVLRGLAPYAIILLGLLASIVATHLILRAQFVRPALALVEHLRAEGEGRAGRRVDIPRLWQPWADLVSRIFADNRAAIDRLVASEERYRSVVEAQTEFVLRQSPDGYLSFVNEAYCRYLGKSREELLSPDWCDLDNVPADERQRFMDHLARLTPERPVAAIELQNVLPDGSETFSAWVDKGIFDEEGRLIEVQSVGRNVTDRVRAERARQETERLRQLVLEAALDGYICIDEEGRIVELNAAAEAIFGHGRADAIGQSMSAMIVPPSMRRAHEDGFARHLRDGSTRVLGRRIEVTALHADGREFPIELVIVRSEREGRPAFIAYMRDLTEQKRAAAALAESEAQLRAITEGVPLSIVISALEKPDILFVNERARHRFGLEPGDAGERAIKVWEDPAQRYQAAEIVRRDGYVDAFEAGFLTADGGRMDALISARRIEHGGRPALLAAITDITQQRIAEAEVARQREALHQNEKLSALGSLLAGVAHELNNPLSVVVGYSSMLKELASDAATATRADKIHAAAERCSRIVRTFLAMARKKPPSRGAVDVNEIVRSSLEIAAYGLRSAGVEVRTQLVGDLPAVWGDADQLHQVVTNLIVNAQQALLSVPDPRRLTIVTAPCAEGVEIIVADNGPGMAPEVRARIFEPFYTTKAAGVGTGVGLSVCAAIVAAHEGALSVDSEEGAGARFRVVLPTRAAGFTLPAPERAAATRAATPARVLVVDDEPDIASMIAELLRNDGHEVVVCADAAMVPEAARRGGVDLVVSDIRMPGLDGPGLHEALARLVPGMERRILFVTGDTLAPEIGRFIAETSAPVIEKPIDPQAFRRVVAERLSTLTEEHR